MGSIACSIPGCKSDVADDQQMSEKTRRNIIAKLSSQTHTRQESVAQRTSVSKAKLEDGNIVTSGIDHGVGDKERQAFLEEMERQKAEWMKQKEEEWMKEKRALQAKLEEERRKFQSKGGGHLPETPKDIIPTNPEKEKEELECALDIPEKKNAAEEALERLHGVWRNDDGLFINFEKERMSVYFSIDGYNQENKMHIESGNLYLNVGDNCWRIDPIEDDEDRVRCTAVKGKNAKDIIWTRATKKEIHNGMVSLTERRSLAHSASKLESEENGFSFDDQAKKPPPCPGKIEEPQFSTFSEFGDPTVTPHQASKAPNFRSNYSSFGEFRLTQRSKSIMESYGLLDTPLTNGGGAETTPNNDSDTQSKQRAKIEEEFADFDEQPDYKIV